MLPTINTCGDLKAFIDSIVQQLQYKGFSGSRFYICEKSRTHEPFLAKLCFYKKTPMELYSCEDDGNVIAQTDAEIQILTLLKKTITDAKISPCVLNILDHHICTNALKTIRTSPECLFESQNSIANEVNKIMCEYADTIKADLALNKYAIVALEKCDITLGEYLARNSGSPVSVIVLKSLLFSIVHAIYVIAQVYPGFHHYDLHTDNIMLMFDFAYQFDVNNPKFTKYVVRVPNGGGIVDENIQTFYIPYFGITPKIIDCGFASIPSAGLVSNITTDLVTMYYRSENDLIFLFHHIHYVIAARNKLHALSDLLQALDPTRSYVNYYTPQIRKLESAGKIPTYANMIMNSQWDEYRDGANILPEQIVAEYVYTSAI